MSSITGIVLVRDDDLHVRQAVANITDFCDRIYLCDHQSRDRTPAILAELAAQNPAKLLLRPVARPGQSHTLLEPLAGTDTWVFGVDGDEIYDPARLAAFRPRLLSGEFQTYWMILGNVLNCDQLDPAAGLASGWLAPPCRSMTKLYNFSAIHSWTGPAPERLHGGNLRFRDGWDIHRRIFLHDHFGWDDAPLRCLHTCFLPRSSAEPPRSDPAAPARENIMDTAGAGLRLRLARLFRRLTGQPLESDWKKIKYRRGPRVEKPLAPFFP